MLKGLVNYPQNGKLIFLTHEIEKQKTKPQHKQIQYQSLITAKLNIKIPIQQIYPPNPEANIQKSFYIPGDKTVIAACTAVRTKLSKANIQ